MKNASLVFTKKDQISYFEDCRSDFFYKKCRSDFLLKNKPDFCFENCRTDFFLKKKKTRFY